MEPKYDPENPKPRIIWVDRTRSWSTPRVDDEWVRQFLESMMQEGDNWVFDPDSVLNELSRLEALDATVQGDDHPATLDMIEQAVRRVRLGH